MENKTLQNILFFLFIILFLLNALDYYTTIQGLNKGLQESNSLALNAIRQNTFMINKLILPTSIIIILLILSMSLEIQRNILISLIFFLIGINLFLLSLVINNLYLLSIA